MLNARGRQTLTVASSGQTGPDDVSIGDSVSVGHLSPIPFQVLASELAETREGWLQATCLPPLGGGGGGEKGNLGEAC
ncbi:hypothetical protein CTA1_1338 [Colletotrichum tanaceti]|uniref:Uncharacterized protein n=1 Tax=Colletotrichum tanaceti TaxID=1306861 RepID=A0A4U6X3Z5_9PEZI|nr:hypothetical protein CTA1_1338 [Colletotrichum tanaceti]